jgi:uncharacterized protein (DUF58 family)
VIRSFKMWWHQLRFRGSGILPTPRLVLLFGSLTVPVLVASLLGGGGIAFIVINSTLVIVSLLDLWTLPRRADLDGWRDLPDQVERGQAFKIHLHLQNQSNTQIRFRVIDDLPSSFYRPFPVEGILPASETVELPYETKASIRGDYTLNKVYFRYRSSLGLWEKQLTWDRVQTIRVLPDMSHVRGTLASAQKMLTLQGNKVKRHQVGSGEFAQIRNYSIDDDPRKINWHASARNAELMTNVYEPEHGKHITILIDCGRTMGVELTEGNRLERSLEAALTVAAIALQQGDYVSVLAFADRIKAYIPPRQGLTHLQSIIQNTYHLQSEPVESDYATALEHLETVQKRRSLILLFSDLDQFMLGEGLVPYIRPIRRRHLFILIGIEDPMIRSWVEKEPVETRLAMTKTMAQRTLLQKRLNKRKWEQMGLQVIEAPEEKVVAEATQRYIEIINRGLL